MSARTDGWTRGERARPRRQTRNIPIQPSPNRSRPKSSPVGVHCVRVASTHRTHTRVNGAASLRRRRTEGRDWIFFFPLVRVEASAQSDIFLGSQFDEANGDGSPGLTWPRRFPTGRKIAARARAGVARGSAVRARPRDAKRRRKRARWTRAGSRAGSRAAAGAPRSGARARGSKAHLFRGELCVSEPNQDSQEGVVRPLVVAVDLADALEEVVSAADGRLPLVGLRVGRGAGDGGVSAGAAREARRGGRARERRGRRRERVEI